jgi:hypothetical protein
MQIVFLILIVRTVSSCRDKQLCKNALLTTFPSDHGVRDRNMVKSVRSMHAVPVGVPMWTQMGTTQRLCSCCGM